MNIFSFQFFFFFFKSPSAPANTFVLNFYVGYNKKHEISVFVSVNSSALVESIWCGAKDT